MVQHRLKTNQSSIVAQYQLNDAVNNPYYYNYKTIIDSAAGGVDGGDCGDATRCDSVFPSYNNPTKMDTHATIGEDQHHLYRYKRKHTSLTEGKTKRQTRLSRHSHRDMNDIGTDCHTIQHTQTQPDHISHILKVSPNALTAKT